jgi:hypothetical protein
MNKILLIPQIILLVLTCGCSTPPATFETGPKVEVDVGVAELSVEVTIDSHGDVVLSGDFALTTLGPIGVGWTVGFEKVLHEARRETAALYILWQDTSGEIWSKKYLIGEPFTVTFNDRQWVREIRSQGDSIIVAVEPIGSPPDYADLKDDVRYLVERWDEVHYDADHNWDTSNLKSVLSGAALQEQRDTVEWLKSNNCYWEIYELMTPQITYFEKIGSRSLVVDVRKNWDMDLYCNDKKNDDDDGYFAIPHNLRLI